MEMNGGLILDTADVITRSLEAGSLHCTSTVTSMSTVSGSVTLQARVCEVPSYSGPLGTLRSRVGGGTGGETHTQDGAGHTIHRELPHHLQLTVTLIVELMVAFSTPAGPGVTTVP